MFWFQWLERRYCRLVFRFFRINNIELKCSFVRCQIYHKSLWNGAAELYTSVDLLCCTTAAELHSSVDLLRGTTAAEIPHNLVDFLCVAQRPPSYTLGWFTLWHNGRRATTQLGRFPLCGTTAAKLHNSVDLLCVTTAAELLHNSGDSLCVAQRPAELHNSVDLDSVAQRPPSYYTSR